MRRGLALSLIPLLLANADPASIPPAVRAMLEAAMAAGNEAEVATIAKYATAGDPNIGEAVLAITGGWHEAREEARTVRIAEASALDLWAGRAELGGYASAGNTSNVGVTGVVDVAREGIEWRHKLSLQADYQQSAGVATRKHFLAAYEPNWKVGTNRYVYGAAQFESDPFLGYDARYSASAGAGYGAIRSPSVTLDVELGPAYRQTEYVDASVESSLAARGKVDLDWKLSPRVTLSQDASAYLQRYNSTLNGTTALAAKLVGPLSAQLSYTIQYESMPAVGRTTTDTTSRASLVYSF